MKHLLVTMLLVLSLSGCATTDSGKAADRAVHADVVSTGIALAINDSAVEANPVALPFVVIRYWVNQWADDLPCAKRNRAHAPMAVFGWAYAANNLGAAAAVSWHPLLAIPGAIFGYWRYKENRCTALDN